MKQIIIFAIIAITYCGCSPSEPKASKDDVVGTWTIDRELSKNDKDNTVPEDYFSFVLNFNEDGTFVAENVPNGFLIDRPHGGKTQSGTWILGEYLDRIPPTAPNPIKLTFENLPGATEGVCGSYILREKDKWSITLGGLNSYIVITRKEIKNPQQSAPGNSPADAESTPKP